MRKECVMAGKENIEPYKYDAEKARVAGKVGGVKSGEAKRKKKLLRDLLMVATAHSAFYTAKNQL
jgi:hypothetical protein